MIDLLNTHLESMWYCAEERTRQLTDCFDIVTQRPADRTVILAGDLNLTEDELSSVGGLPEGVNDIWEQLGSSEEVMNV